MYQFGYLGTPCQAFDVKGEKVWETELDIYGKIRKLEGENDFVPFRYQGQYEDVESGLYYNRFRYYDYISGNYISQDPIGLAGGNPTMYGYVNDSNTQIDPFGLECKPKGKKINRTVYRYTKPEYKSTTWDVHSGNIGSTHRYTKKGIGGVYGANSSKTAMAEISHWGVEPNGVELVNKKVSLNNVLDLTDSKVRSQLGVNLSDISGNNYDATHKIGDWAIKNGYDGILAPSARNLTGTNLIGFTGF
mgnify:CR=1 FL=1